MSQSSPTSSNPLKHSQFSEYKILYSTNLVQKSKIYHDGRCKFFRFNKKLIIYDEDNTVISTHFLTNARVLEVQGKETKINEDIWIIIEEKLGDYERDISNLFNSKADKLNDKIVNRRITINTPEKENTLPTIATKMCQPRRIGMSKLSSPKYLGTTTPLRQREQQRTPLTEKSHSINSVDSGRRIHYGTLKSLLGGMPSPVTPLEKSKSRSISDLLSDEQVPTNHKRSKIDVYASDNDENISEDFSDFEADLEGDIVTQTRTYDYSVSDAHKKRK